MMPENTKHCAPVAGGEWYKRFLLGAVASVIVSCTFAGLSAFAQKNPEQPQAKEQEERSLRGQFKTHYTETREGPHGENYMGTYHFFEALSGGVNNWPAGAKTNYSGAYFEMVNRTVGQHQVVNAIGRCHTRGDCFGIDSNLWFAGGQIANGDEGVEGISSTVIQQQYVAAGSVVSVAGDLLNYSASGPYGFNNLGELYTINTTPAKVYAAGSVAGIAGKSLTVTFSGAKLAQFCPNHAAPCDVNHLFFSLDSETKPNGFHNAQLKLVLPIVHIADDTHANLGCQVQGQPCSGWFGKTNTGPYKIFFGALTKKLTTPVGPTGQMQMDQNIAGVFAPGDTWEQPDWYTAAATPLQLLVEQELATPITRAIMQLYSSGITRDVAEIAGNHDNTGLRNGLFFTTALSGAGLLFEGAPPTQGGMYFGDHGAADVMLAQINRNSGSGTFAQTGFKFLRASECYQLGGPVLCLDGRIGSAMQNWAGFFASSHKEVSGLYVKASANVIREFDSGAEKREIWLAAGNEDQYRGGYKLNIWRSNDGAGSPTIAVDGSNGTITANSTITAPAIALASKAAPPCNASIRGQFNYVAGGAGVKDVVQVCAKDAADRYAWRTIY